VTGHGRELSQRSCYGVGKVQGMRAVAGWAQCTDGSATAFSTRRGVADSVSPHPAFFSDGADIHGPSGSRPIPMTRQGARAMRAS